MPQRGPQGQFANLLVKNRHEVPMAVLLPTGGPVRSTIAGTDFDGFREVNGITAVYEIKAMGAPVSDGQLRALQNAGTFAIGSRWLYRDVNDEPAQSENEEIARKCGYTRYAVPVSAVVWAHTDESKIWLPKYLKQSKIEHQVTNNQGYHLRFSDPGEMLKTHIFRPTPEWLVLAYVADYFAKYLLDLEIKAPYLF